MKNVDGIIYFECYDKHDLSPIEMALLKNHPEKYRLGFPGKKSKKNKKQLSSQEIFDKAIERQNKKKEKELESIWKNYDEMKKNPKKYNKKRKKRENLIMKYFEKQDEKEIINAPKGMKKIVEKENKLKKENFIMYFEVEQHQESWNNIMQKKKKKCYNNPNKMYTKKVMERVDRHAGDAKRVALLKTLEEELLAKLSDPLAMMQPNNIAVDFKDEVVMKEIKKKKKKKDKKKKKNNDIHGIVI